MFKIYKLIDPRTNEIKYIGKTKKIDINKRLICHIRMSLKNSKTKKEKWICSLLSKNIKPIIEIIEKCSEYNREQREIYWIKFYNEIYNLTNSTSGGDGIKNAVGEKNGMFGKKHKLSSKKMMSEKAKKRTGIKNSMSKLIYQYDLEGNFIKKWDYCKEAADEYKILRGNLSSAANYNTTITNNNYYKVSKNFIFSFNKCNKIENIIIHRNAKRFIKNDI